MTSVHARLTLAALAMVAASSLGAIPPASAEAFCLYWQYEDGVAQPRYLGPDSGPNAWERTHPYPAYWDCKNCPSPFRVVPEGLVEERAWVRSARLSPVVGKVAGAAGVYRAQAEDAYSRLGDTVWVYSNGIWLAKEDLESVAGIRQQMWDQLGGLVEISGGDQMLQRSELCGHP